MPPMHNNDVSPLLMITLMLWHNYFMQLPLPSHSPLALIVTSDADRQALIIVQVFSVVSLVLSKLLPPQSPKMALEMTTLMYWTRWNVKRERI